MNEKFTLSELNSLIKKALSGAFPGTVWVVAEVSELKENRNGHCYLELVEKEGETIMARSRATIWSYTYRMLKPYFETSTKRLFEAGIKVLLKVSVEFHEVYGMSMNIKDIDPTYTLGDMALQRKEIIDRLIKEGVFEMNRELMLPVVPQKIAVISSSTAAGYQDFMDQLENNEKGIRFYTHLFEAYMQGAEAAGSIIKALERIFQYEDFFDVVAIIRGGGATADLSSFDHYDLAFNITQFPLPVITGIGHEKDDTIIDLVAHTRMKTPTAVAQFIVGGAEQFMDRLLSLENEVVRATRKTIDSKRNELERRIEKMESAVNRFIRDKRNELSRMGGTFQQLVHRFSDRRQYQIKEVKQQLRSAMLLKFLESKNRIARQKVRLKGAVSDEVAIRRNELKEIGVQITSTTRSILLKEKKRLDYNENSIRLLDPGNVLERGYTLTTKDGKILKNISGLKPGDDIETRFSDGKVKSKINKIEK